MHLIPLDYALLATLRRKQSPTLTIHRNLPSEARRHIPNPFSLLDFRVRAALFFFKANALHTASTTDRFPPVTLKSNPVNRRATVLKRRCRDFTERGEGKKQPSWERRKSGRALWYRGFTGEGEASVCCTRDGMLPFFFGSRDFEADACAHDRSCRELYCNGGMYRGTTRSDAF